jgi:hypothetical protein
LQVESSPAFVGAFLQLTILAYDSAGSEISTDRAVVSSSDEAVADIVKAGTVPMRDDAWRTWERLYVKVRLRSAGTVNLRVSLDNRSDSSHVVVAPSPVPGRALVVDSFTVVEYRASCVWDCPYLVYAPLLKLREPTGIRTVEVAAVEFTLGEMTTGLCEGDVTYTPGLSKHLNGIDDYLWSNDLIFVSLGGDPLPADTATARVIIRNPGGSYSEVDATGPVVRMVANPIFPPPNPHGWRCR